MFKSRKIYSFLLILFTIGSLKSQSISANRVIYKIGLYEETQANSSTSEKKISPAMMTSIAEIDKALFELEFELLYDEKGSVYKMISQPNYDSGPYKIAITLGSGNSSYFVNTLTNELIIKKSISGQNYHMITTTDELKWEVTGETKMIQGVLCRKATSYFEEFNDIKQKNMSFYPFVWFAEEIENGYGPRNFVGLPGLVLEGTINGRLYFYASEINTDIEVSEKSIRTRKLGKEVRRDIFNGIN